METARRRRGTCSLRLPFRGELGVHIRDWLVKSQRLDVAAKLAQWIKSSPSAAARVGDEIVKAFLARDDNKMSGSACESHPHDHRISAGQI